MAIITLTSDYGTRDPYAAMVRGAILTQVPDATVVDISHGIDPFDIAQSSYVIASSYESFPAGSIHIISTDAERTPLREHVAMKYNGHYFIAADNGVLSLLLRGAQPEELVTINIHKYIERNFPVLDVFVQVASLLARGGQLSTIGRERDSLKMHERVSAQVNAESVIGTVIYVDNYGNAVSNVSRNVVQAFAPDGLISLNLGFYKLESVRERYSDIVNWKANTVNLVKYEGRALAIYNAMDLVEIGVYYSTKQSGGAASLLNLVVGKEFVISRRS